MINSNRLAQCIFVSGARPLFEGRHVHRLRWDHIWCGSWFRRTTHFQGWRHCPMSFFPAWFLLPSPSTQAKNPCPYSLVFSLRIGFLANAVMVAAVILLRQCIGSDTIPWPMAMGAGEGSATRAAELVWRSVGLIWCAPAMATDGIQGQWRV